MKKILTYFVFISITTATFGQTTGSDLDENKNGAETANFTLVADTLIFYFRYFYDEPYSFDEEYTEIITIKILKSTFENNKTFTIPNPNVSIAAKFISVWYFDKEYEDLQGQIEIIENGNNKIKLSVSLSGKFKGLNTTRELINKTLEYKRVKEN